MWESNDKLCTLLPKSGIFIVYTEFTNVATGHIIHLAVHRLETHGIGHFHNLVLCVVYNVSN